MGALFGGSMGGKGKSQQADWAQIEKLMDMSMKANRFEDSGLFGGTEWTENPDGTWERQQTANEALQPGIEAMMGRASNPIQEYGAPDQFSQMLDAKMANQMGRQGILNPGQERPPTDFGTPAAQQPQNNAFTTPPPQQQPPQPSPEEEAAAMAQQQQAAAMAQQQQAGPQQQQQGGPQQPQQGGQWELMQKIMQERGMQR